MPAPVRMVDADIEFHGWDESGLNAGLLPHLRAAPAPGPRGTARRTARPVCKAVDVGTVALPRGRPLGGARPHLPLPGALRRVPCESVMEPTVSTGGPTRRTLGADDVSGVCTIYPRGAATLTCNSRRWWRWHHDVRRRLLERRPRRRARARRPRRWLCSG